MRIGIDARLVYYSQAGIGQYILHLVNGLSRIDRENEYVLLQSRKDETNILHQPNFHRVSLWTPSHHRLERYSMNVELMRLGLDVLHSPDFIPPHRPSCRSVITVHDLAFLLYPHFLTKESARYYGHIDQAVRWTDHIIAVSESTRRDTIQHLGVPQDKITVVHEAANPIFRPIDRKEAAEEVRVRYGVDAPFVLFVSTIEPRKNVPTLMRAIWQLQECYKEDVHLILAGGKGWLFEDAFASVEEFKLDSRVHFVGRVSSEELLYLYNAAELLAHPAFYEGFGLPPLEAMACGLPVVVSNVASLPEVVGDAGLLIDPHDVDELTVNIWRVLNDDQLREEMREKGLRQAQRFSWDRAARETKEIYRLVIKE
ncbi:MAG: glycosyltransferase family 1 protein [Anaerolineae bacterium]|jgi:glycosyltransferase involved in cell wall biosynthesis|nr:glycosyltransferase family 1 protein [Anaerolineae bacterium]MDX9829093.1 glycosyltransferase family 1 protein [Anaerolineae bacterium]